VTIAPAMTKEELAILPASERKKAEREAQQAAKAAEKARIAEEEANKPPEPTPEPAPVVEPPVPQPPVEPPVEPVAADTIGPKEYERLKADYDKLKHQHKTLQGKFNAEVPRFKKEAKEREDKLAARLEALERAKITPAPVMGQPVESAVPAHLKYLSEDEREEAGVGESLVLKQMRGLLEEKVAPLQQELDSVKAENEQLKKTTDAEKQGSRDTVIWKAVEQSLPGARSVFNHALIGEYLEDTPDPGSVTGASLFDTANTAFMQGRAAEVATILKVAADAIGMEVEAGQENVAPPAQPPVKPGVSASVGAPKSPAAAKDIPVSEIEEFYSLLSKPKGQGPRHKDGTPWTSDEIKAKEKEYDRAMSQGRIIRDK